MAVIIKDINNLLKVSLEAKVKWKTLDKMLARKLAPNIIKYLAGFRHFRTKAEFVEYE